jgi:hypothetical protein
VRRKDITIVEDRSRQTTLRVDYAEHLNEIMMSTTVSDQRHVAIGECAYRKREYRDISRFHSCDRRSDETYIKRRNANTPRRRSSLIDNGLVRFDAINLGRVNTPRSTVLVH